MIPFVDLKPYVELVRGGRFLHGIPVFEAGFTDALFALLDRGEFVGGSPTTREFESALATKLDVQSAVACANGTDALQLALRAYNIGHGHRVVMPNITFWATFEAIVNVGATPLLLDVDSDYYQLSLPELRRAYAARRFDAVVLPHLFGWCSDDLAEIRAFCREKRVPLIEDGAQAFGVKYGGVSVFAEAEIATLSFYPAKVIGGIGDGGAVLTKRNHLLNRVRALANHGRVGHFEHVAVGWNSRMDTIQATWLLRALAVSDKVIAERRRLARLHGFPDGPHVVPPMAVDDNGYLQLNMVRWHEAHAVQQRLADLGVEARRMYPTTIADQPGAKAHAITIGSLLNSRAFAERALCLPLYYGMTDEQVERCTKAFESVLR